MIESRAEFKPTSGQHYNETVIVIYESELPLRSQIYYYI